MRYKCFETDDPEFYKSKVCFILNNDMSEMEPVFAEEKFNKSGQLDKVREDSLRDLLQKQQWVEYSKEKEMATHPSILAWRIPGTEEPSGLPSMGSDRVGYNWATKHSTAVDAKSLQSCWTLWDPLDCNTPGSSVPGDSPGENIRVGCHALLQGNLPTPAIEPRSPVLQADSLLSEPSGKPKNAEVGSLFLLQGNLPPQQSNWGLLLFSQIPYQLSYPGTPHIKETCL